MIRLHTLLGDHPHLLPLKQGSVRSPTVALDFADEPQPHEAFKPFVRDLAFDCGELAIATFLQARAYGKPLFLLPATVSSRFHQGSIFYNSSKGELAPKDIEQRSVAVRTYSQTTGVWVRGLLHHEYGVDNDSVTWVTCDESHLAEYVDPPNTRRAAPGKLPDTMLREGEVAAAIPVSLASKELQAPPFKTLVPNPTEAARQWYDRHKIVPINHMFVVRTSVARANPEAVRELFRLICESKEKSAAGPVNGVDMVPIGIEQCRRSLELVVQFAFEQHVIPERVSVDELFKEFCDIVR